MELIVEIVRKTKNYTCIDNGIFKDSSLSAKAKGVLCTILSLPPDWDFSIVGISKVFSDGESAIRTALKELEYYGYLKRERVYVDGKIDSWKYTIFEEKQELENLDEENLQEGNQGQLSTESNKVIKEKLSTNHINNNVNNSQLFNTTKIVKKKETIYSKCINIIEKYTLDKELQDKLKDYLKIRLSKHQLTTKQWNNILDRLTEFGKTKEDKLKMLNNSIVNQWGNVYELRNYKNNSKYYDPCNERDNNGNKCVFSQFDEVNEKNKEEDLKLSDKEF